MIHDKRLSDDVKALIEGGEVLSVGDNYVTVDVDGHEVHISFTVRRSGCSCCGDTVRATVSYNRPKDDDPLGIK